MSEFTGSVQNAWGLISLFRCLFLFYLCLVFLSHSQVGIQIGAPLDCSCAKFLVDGIVGLRIMVRMCKPVEYQNGINDLHDINAELIFVHRWLIISIVMYLAKKTASITA